MKSIFFVFIVNLLLACNYSFAQNTEIITTSNLTHIEQGFTYANLTGHGYSSFLSSTCANIGSINPSSIYDYKVFSLGLSYQYDSKIDISPAENTVFASRVNNYVPQSVGIVVPFKGFRFGFALNQNYNLKLDFGKTEIKTINNPTGTGEFVSVISETYVLDQSFIIAYAFQKVASQTDQIIPSLQLHRNSINYDLHSIKNDSFLHLSFNWTIGLRYDYRFDDIKRLKIGIHYNKKSRIEGLRSETTGFLMTVPPETTLVKNYLTGFIPGQLIIGIDIDVIRNLQFLVGLERVFWGDIPSNSYWQWRSQRGYIFNPLYELENQNNINANAIYKLCESFNFSLGFFNSTIHYKEKFNNDDFDRNRERFYLTTGAKYSFENFDIDLVIADSHLFVEKLLKQTIGKLLVSYHY